MKLRITVEGVAYDVDVELLEEGEFGSPPPSAGAPPQGSPGGAAGGGRGGEIASPLAGTVFDIRVKPGDRVNVNDTLLVLEAMKMESNIASTISGTVSEICVKVGDSVSHGDVLVRFA